MGNFRKLRVWRVAHALMINCHRAARAMKGGEYLALRSQIIRASMSIPANIVEGRARRSERDFVRFIGYAVASGRELEYHLLAARDVEAIDPRSFDALTEQLTDVLRMLHGLRMKLEQYPSGSPPEKALRN